MNKQLRINNTIAVKKLIQPILTLAQHQLIIIDDMMHHNNHKLYT